MKTLTDKLRALATTPEFEDTTTAKLFLEIADQAERVEADKTRLDSGMIYLGNCIHKQVNLRTAIDYAREYEGAESFVEAPTE